MPSFVQCLPGCLIDDGLGLSQESVATTVCSLVLVRNMCGQVVLIVLLIVRHGPLARLEPGFALFLVDRHFVLRGNGYEVEEFLVLFVQRDFVLHFLTL